MELELFRQDLVQTSTSAPGTLAVLPLGEEKKSQKVAVGDMSGVLQCFSVKKGEVAMAFKLLPSAQKVTSVTLGKGRGQRDKIFVAAGNQIKGMSKKGKEFFRFNTQLTEAIRRIDVQERNIWSCAEYVHNHFIEGKEKALFLAPDRINDAEIVPLVPNPNADPLPVLACQDRTLRVLSGAEVVMEAPTPAAPTACRYVPDSHDPQNRFPQSKELLLGTEAGTLTQVMLDAQVARQGFSLPNPRKLGAVRAVFSGLDLSKTGTNDVVLGREDGLLEVYDVDDAGQLQAVYSTKLSESINSIDCGYVTSANAQELVLHTFSGKVISYAQAGGGLLLPLMMLDPPAPAGSKKKSEKEKEKAMALAGTNPANEDAERMAGYAMQINRLRQEIDALRQQVEGERQRFLTKGGDAALLAISTPFTVQDKVRLEPDEACYTLFIESSVPIFTVAIQCAIPLQLLDVPANVAILSRSPPDEANGNLTLATYRCQDSTSRVSIKFKVREGKGGVLTAFVIPQASPKTCISVKHAIRPLCLHVRVPDMDANRPTNELLITGSFDFSDVHGWVAALLPDVPPSMPPGGSATYFFQNTLLGTQLACRYRAGEARFTSDLISTLGILHEHLMREATSAKHRVTTSFNPSAQSLQHSVALVWPQLERQRTLKNKFQLLEGLEELKMQDPDLLTFLAPDYSAILTSADAIRAEFKEQPQHLDHLCALVKDLYIDFCKLTGVSGTKARLPMLQQLLGDTRSTLDQVMDFMLGKL